MQIFPIKVKYSRSKMNHFNLSLIICRQKCQESLTYHWNILQFVVISFIQEPKYEIAFRKTMHITKISIIQIDVGCNFIPFMTIVLRIVRIFFFVKLVHISMCQNHFTSKSSFLLIVNTFSIISDCSSCSFRRKSDKVPTFDKKLKKLT